MNEETSTYRGFTLDPFQQQAIQALKNGASVLVSAPTGTGKTLIADYVVEQALSRQKTVIYTAPVKALSNQKYRDWCRLHGAERVGLVTGDLVIRRDADCRVMTTEILRNMLLTGEQLPDLDAVIIDEIHFLDDAERGTTWEEVLIYLPKTVQILGLSATLSNLDEFATWLGEVRETRVEVVKAERRNVPLHFHIFGSLEGLHSPKEFQKAWGRVRGTKKPPKARRGRHRPERDEEGQTHHTEVIDCLEQEQLLPCLFFVFSRKNTERFSRELAWHLDHSLLNNYEIRELVRVLDAYAKEQPLDMDLRELYLTGVAFHHAGLNVQLKALVEELYEKRLIKALYCTSTFALGINMPARTVVFDGLFKFDGSKVRPLTNREFQQKAGRAGRRGLDTEGHIVVRMDHGRWPDDKIHLEGYLQGKSEPVRSSFSLCFNSIVNLMERHPTTRIREIVDKSFLSWCRAREAARLDERVQKHTDETEKPDGGKTWDREVRRMASKAVSMREKSWGEFEERVQFLKTIGYLNEDNSFNTGAVVLKHVQIEEILVTEFVLAGVLENLPPALLYGVCCAMNREFPRDTRINYRMKGQDADIARRGTRIRHSEVVTHAEALTKLEVTWCPDMIAFGRMWAEGKSLEELSRLVVSQTDLTGDLVGAFRRAKDLIQQLRLVWWEDKVKRDELAELLKRVSRDEVLVVD
jgi:superfamily II RNA helicase